MSEASYPGELLYHPEHDWARLDGELATFGITWHAQDALGDIVFFDAPKLGTQLSQNEPYSEIESVKAVSDVYAPLSGEVVEVNEQLNEHPELVNQDPYGEGWMVRVRIADGSEAQALLDRDAYVATLEE